MKKVIAYIVLLIFILIYIISIHTDYMKKVTEFKYSSNSVFGSDKYKYGDLYGLSYIPKYKELMVDDKSEVRSIIYPKLDQVNLCLVHDSYLSSFFLKSKSQFYGIDTIYNIVYSWQDNESSHIQINKKKHTVLVFEIAERNFMSVFDSLTIVRLIKFDVFKRSIHEKEKKNDINTNLEFILFDSHIFSPFKELKAYINSTFFNRIVPDVFISKNKEYLFYSETKSSIFNQIDSNIITKKVLLLNYIYEFYKNKGFDEVYLSIIPNPVSIIKPESESYNNLIPLIQEHKNLKMPIIDIYSIFKNTKHQVYFHSDSHWNRTGLQLWLNELNLRLYEFVKSKKDIK